MQHETTGHFIFIGHSNAIADNIFRNDFRSSVHHRQLIFHFTSHVYLLMYTLKVFYAIGCTVEMLFSLKGTNTAFNLLIN